MPRLRLYCWLTVLLLLPACALPRGERELYGRDPLPQPLPPKHKLFVCDGSGDYRICSSETRRAAREDGWPVDVITYVWSHGRFRLFADHTDATNIYARGRELAGQVIQAQRCQPQIPISILGHSSGCAVALVAAENLPPGTLDRLVLFAPAVSVKHDLRPALTSVRGGLDVFYSRDDRFFMGVMMTLFGTADDSSETMAAGRYGFKPEIRPGEEVVFSKLKQYEWNATLEQIGNDGSHFGAYAQGHLKKFVLPLFQYGPIQ